MSTENLAAQAEVLKLSRVLGTDAGRLDYLARVDPAELQILREQMTDTLFDANLQALQRMALACRLLPGSVLANVAEKVFGPLLCARIAGLVDVSRGVDVAKRLSPRFLAEVAVELDPRRASAIISRIPLETVVAVAAELVAAEDWITLGRFVGHLPDPTVRASLTVIDDAALIRVAFVLDDKSRIDHVFGLLPEKRFIGLMRATVVDPALGPPALDMLSHLSPARRQLLLPFLDKLPDTLRAQAQAMIK